VGVKQIISSLAFEQLRMIALASDQFEIHNQIGSLLFGLLVALAFESQNLAFKHAWLNNNFNARVFCASSSAV
jgi:hypothetical protein